MSYSRYIRNYHPWREHNYFYTDNESAETEAEVDSYNIESEVMDIKPDDIPDPIACASEYNPYLNYFATDTQDQPADVEIKKEIKEEPPDDDVVVSLEELATQLQELVMQSGNESSTALPQQVAEPITQSNPDEQTRDSNIVPVIVNQQENALAQQMAAPITQSKPDERTTDSNIVPVVVNQQENDQQMEPNSKKQPGEEVISASSKEVSDAVSTFNIVVEPGSSSQFAVYVDPKEGENLGKVLLFSVKALPTDNSTEKESSETSSNNGESMSAVSQENQTKIPPDTSNTLKPSISLGENTSEILISDTFNTSDSNSTNTLNTTSSDKEIDVIHASKSISDDTSVPPESADSHVSDSVGSNSLKPPQSANNSDEIHTSKSLTTYSVKPSQLFHKTYSKHSSKSHGSYTLRSSQFASKTYANHTLKSISNNSFKSPKSVNNTNLYHSSNSIRSNNSKSPQSANNLASNSIRSNNSKSPQSANNLASNSIRSNNLKSPQSANNHASNFIRSNNSKSPQSANNLASNSIRSNSLKSPQSANIRDSKSLRTYNVKRSLFANKTYSNRISNLVSCLKPPQSTNITNQIHALQSLTSNSIKRSQSTNNTDLIQTPKSVDSTDLMHHSKSIKSNTSKNSESTFLHSIKSSGTITVNASHFSKKMKLTDISKSSIGKDMRDSKKFRIHSTNNNPNSILKSSQKAGLTNSHQSLSCVSRLVNQAAQNSLRSSQSVSGNNLKSTDTGVSQVAAVSRSGEAKESPAECEKETHGIVQQADSTTADVTFLDHTYSLSLRTDNLSRIRSFPWPITTDIDGTPVRKRLRLMTDDSYRPLDRMYGHMKRLQLELAMMDLERAKLDLEITRLQAQHEREIADLRLRNAEELIRMEADWCLLPGDLGLWD